MFDEDFIKGLKDHADFLNKQIAKLGEIKEKPDLSAKTYLKEWVRSAFGHWIVSGDNFDKAAEKCARFAEDYYNWRKEQEG